MKKSSSRLFGPSERLKAPYWSHVDKLKANNAAVTLREAIRDLNQQVQAATRAPKLRRGAETQKLDAIAKAKEIIQMLSSTSLPFDEMKNNLAYAAYVYGQLREQLESES